MTDVLHQPAHDVFVSYSTIDKPVADAIVARLEQAGVRCWVAPRDVMPGTLFSEGIVRAIHTSRLMVVVVSSQANQSHNVIREVGCAVSSNVVVLPFRIEAFELNEAMSFYLAAEHWLDAVTPPMESHIAELVKVALVLLGSVPAAGREQASADVLPTPDAKPPPPPPPPPLGSRFKALINPGHDWPIRHKPRAGVIAAIIAAAVIIIATVTIVRTDSPTASSSSVPSPILSASSPASSAPSPSSGSAVLIGRGISIVPVSGWGIATQDKDLLVFLSNNDAFEVTLLVSLGDALSTDIGKALSEEIRLYVGESAQVSPLGKPSARKGKNFTQAVSAPYRCAPSSQGTSSNPACPSDSVGIFTYLLNTSTGQGAFIDFSAPTKSALQAHKADADKMINSLG